MALLVPAPSFGYYVATDDTPSSAAAWGTTLTASGTAHVKGAWAALLTTITYELCLLRMHTNNMFTAVTSCQSLLDLGIGPDSSNVTVVAENLITGNSGAPNNNGLGRYFSLPLRIPAGTQLWGRIQAAVISDTLNVNVEGFGGTDLSLPSGSYIEAMGANTGTSAGTSITPGASGAEGAYAQMSASSASDYIALLGTWTTTDTTSSSTPHYTIKAGIGAATEDQIGMCGWGMHSTAETVGGVFVPVYRNIPSGTRVALRMSASGTADATMSAAAYGVRP